MSDDQNAGMGINQSGKSGGDAMGSACSGTFASGGGGMGHGSAWVQNVDPIGIGVGLGGDAGAAGMAGQMGGDVTDNTSIGSINISS